jgi:hypothetical protein
VGFRTDVEKTYERAADLYAQGRYSEAGSLSSRIEHACQQLLLLGRSLAGGGGLIATACSVLLATHVLGLTAVTGILVALAIVGGSGAFLYWRATAPDTKREIRIAFQAALVGIAVCIGLL